jgi:hypothetical protein
VQPARENPRAGRLHLAVELIDRSIGPLHLLGRRGVLARRLGAVHREQVLLHRAAPFVWAGTIPALFVVHE